MVGQKDNEDICNDNLSDALIIFVRLANGVVIELEDPIRSLA